MIRRCAWLVFALVFVWKAVLFGVSTQPVPANDAFFYDGAVVHYLLHGGYYNPTLAQAFPISGTKVFSAYPPLYQVALLGWMKIFGTTALSTMALHLALFGLYLLVLFAILRRLEIPPWCINLAGGFLLVLTFHDRPDSLAQLLGMLALYAGVRAALAEGKSPGWTWLMALFIALTFCTSLQIGATYYLVVLIATFAFCRCAKKPEPVFPLALMTLSPLFIAIVIRFAFPVAWVGFVEHLHTTPSLTGLRMPHWQEMVKIIRTVPGILLVFVLILLGWLKRRDESLAALRTKQGIVLLSALVPALAILGASLTITTANWVNMPAYLQPLIVAAFLTLCTPLTLPRNWLRLQIAVFLAAILLGAVRAIGMSTWGIACAKDVNYFTAIHRVGEELSNLPAHSKVVASSAFLYEASRHDDLELIHSDWMAPPKGDSFRSDTQALVALKPKELILTQYDFYRRFQPVLNQLKTDPTLADLQITNLAHTSPPDSIKSLQQVVQHISWAPVIVKLTWR